MARGDKTVMLTARITEDQLEFLEKLGDGSRTRGLDEVLSFAMLTRNPDSGPAKPPITTQPKASKLPERMKPAPAIPRRFIGKPR